MMIIDEIRRIGVENVLPPSAKDLNAILVWANHMKHFVKPDLGRFLEVSAPPVFDITNILQYTVQNGYTTEDVMPPYSTFWMEYRQDHPNASIQAKKTPVGTFWKVLDIEQASDVAQTKRMSEEALERARTSGARWVAYSWTFIRDLRVNKIRGLGCVINLISGSGQVLENWMPLASGVDETMARDEITSKLMMAVNGVAVSAISFMAMTNVVYLEQGGQPRFRKARRNLASPPPTRYKTIAIGEVNFTKRGASKGDGHMPLTNVRGHVIRSGVAGPDGTMRKHLFGNPDIKGRFWIPGHRRGDSRYGSVVKDYVIKEPSQDGSGSIL